MKKSQIKFSQNAPTTWYPACQNDFPPKLEDIQTKTLQNQWVLSMCGFDADQYDLSAYPADMFSYTSLTKWGKKPKGFNPEQVLEGGKNPGLGLRALHQLGLDGTGMSMAIIDSPMMRHPEYEDNIVYYETFGYGENPYASMHASAVSSISVGKTCGVAPKAKLYLLAANSFEKNCPDGMYTSKDKQTYLYYIQALERILEINARLPEQDKIKIVSVSWDLTEPQADDFAQMKAVLDKCQEAGIVVNHTGIQREGLKEHGLDRDISKSADDITGYKEAYFFQDKYQKDTLSFPMCHRTVASHVRPDEYLHESAGGWSWIKPYESALFLLAKQVDPDLTFEDFWKLGLKTASKNGRLNIVNPVRLVNTLSKEMLKKLQDKKSLTEYEKSHIQDLQKWIRGTEPVSHLSACLKKCAGQKKHTLYSIVDDDIGRA
ncbi:MAG: hypothetical protein J6Y85_03810 [Alphaproteobacteria bacterium]|nr:hypothetical protein [Alphaproteobacteria bacterium]